MTVHTTPTRRSVLRDATMGIGWCAFASLLAREHAHGSYDPADPLAPKMPPLPARAKRVIHIFMNGGPSQVDTFDPKPALTRYGGQKLPVHLRTERETGAAFPSPFEFRKHGQSGIEVSEIFPKVAEHVDDLCVIRSMHTNIPNHGPSLMLMNTGSSQQSRPSFGSWLTYGLGTENRNLPGFVVLCPGGYPVFAARNWRSAFLPGSFQGTHIDTLHQAPEKLIANVRSGFASEGSQRRQLDLLQRLNRVHASDRPGDALLEARAQSFELAFRMQMEATDVFNVGREPESVRNLYGDTVHGRQMLIARRLLEKGVRVVQVWHGAGQPWDSHSEIEANHRRLAGECDAPIAALLTDLKQRGMLDDTLVIWGGEFGRTPVVELTSFGSNHGKNGRDHNSYGFSMWLAGGGVKGGYVHGATDDFGFRAAEKKVHVHDLHATLLYLLGFDHERFTFRHSGRDFRFTDVHGRVVHDLIS
ncbi:MAG: DUF1501 domain-containing protein [Bryobacterales bacterium]|nr:DUF1501 domain-containing protein [Bryobacterales bacterium]